MMIACMFVSSDRAGGFGENSLVQSAHMPRQPHQNHVLCITGMLTLPSTYRGQRKRFEIISALMMSRRDELMISHLMEPQIDQMQCTTTSGENQHGWYIKPFLAISPFLLTAG
jgi:hypothetical protein